MVSNTINLSIPTVPRKRQNPETLNLLPGNKKVLLAAPRGYCAGVDRAIITVEKALQHYGAPVYVRKQIVHNIHVVKTLEEKGAIFVEENEEVPPGSLLVFSAHGVSPMVKESAQKLQLQTIDATCPLVTKVHKEVLRFVRDDFEILLIGHLDHEEVEGTYGHAPNRIQVVDSPSDVEKITVHNPNKVVWLSQTTLSVDETMKTVEMLRKKFPAIQDPPSDDICYATTNRQVAIKEIAPKSDLVIVVGSENSSNSVRLVEVALEYGAKQAYRVDYAQEINETWFENVQTIGVTSGASVPDFLVKQVLDLLEQYGFNEIEEIVTAKEEILFSLPKELRAKLKESGDYSRGLGGHTVD